MFISPLRSLQELKELDFFLISDRSLSVSVSFFADSFHGSVMVLICEIECSRSTNCYVSVKGESVHVFVYVLMHTQVPVIAEQPEGISPW